jgi:hypothetical protein
VTESKAAKPGLAGFIKIETRALVYTGFGLRLQGGSTIESVIDSFEAVMEGRSDDSPVCEIAKEFGESLKKHLAAAPTGESERPLLAAANETFGNASLAILEVVILDVPRVEFHMGSDNNSYQPRAAAALLAAADLLKGQISRNPAWPPV